MVPKKHRLGKILIKDSQSTIQISFMMKNKNKLIVIALFSVLTISCNKNKNEVKTEQIPTETVAKRTIWTKEKANTWFANQPWLVGANFTPGNAINQLEMWQADTFDPKKIDQELGWAEGIGMNVMRVYLHDLLHKDDSEGLYKRMDEYLTIADKHHIKTLFVLFDSCWDPFPVSRKQKAPQPFLHNSGWVQSPGQKALLDQDRDAFAHELQLSTYTNFEFTNYIETFNCILDYIFYDSNRFELKKVVPMLTREQVTENIALPSCKIPSDHLALIFELLWKK
jgi:hypothetical protein